MQAIILAAGMGKRLKELTNDSTKCMVKVNGVTIIERLLSQIDELNLSKIVIVVGYKGQKLMDYIATLSVKTPIEYINNKIYATTNNIYSLYMAKDYLLRDDTLLFESDLIFDSKLVYQLLGDAYPNLALVDKYESWMDGTVVTVDEDNNILQFVDKKNFNFNNINEYYKTVNIYKFSKEFCKTHYIPFLEAYINALGPNEYYEQVLKVITWLDKPDIKAKVVKEGKWYEIDDVQDLNIAETIFAPNSADRLLKMETQCGGYWRYPKIMDFCCISNPFFPPQKMRDEMNASFNRLLNNQPSGMMVNSLIAAKNFGIAVENTVVGNGAAELIKYAVQALDGKLGIIRPTFEEYPNRKNKEDIVTFFPDNKSFSYDEDDVINFFDDKEISSLILINPDNPSGNYISKAGIKKLAVWAKKKNITFVLDESFVDFADTDDEPTMITSEILKEFPKLIIIKSISNSYGVPGLRLGIIASGDTEFIAQIKRETSIWNINSFSEFYMQIYEKYKYAYAESISKIKVVRKEFEAELSKINHIRVIPSQANYITCEIESGIKSRELAIKLLDKYDILIKDLSKKCGVNGEYIRVAVKLPEENNKLIEALKKELDGTV